MKSKLKVRRIVDSFLSKDDVGFYKIEWEESWLPVDAFQHLKYLIEEFWKCKKLSDGISLQENVKQIEDEENICVEKQSEEKTEECSSSEILSPVAANVEDEKIENGNESNCDNTVSSTSEGEDSTVAVTECSTEEKCAETIRKSTCFFCGQLIGSSDLNSHEHDHIRENCSDVLINLIGESQSDNVFLIHINEKNKMPSEVPLVSKVLPPKPTPDTTTNIASEGNLSIGNPTMTIHHRNDSKSGLSCPVCNESFNLFNDFIVHFQTHRSTPRYFFCEECGKQFLSKELFEKHTQLHIDANRRQKSYGSKISSVKTSRKIIRRVIYPRLYQPSGNTDNYSTSKEQLIDLSESPFGSISGKYGVCSSGKADETKLFVEMLETNRYRKRARKDAAEFSPDVLRSARQYIKAVSKRRKIIKRTRLEAHEKEKDNSTAVSAVNTLVDGIGVDVELERSEDSLPILSFIDGKKAYSCKICNKTFFNKFHHREHYNVHSGEMPYECEFCLKRFAQRSGWNRHIKLHHKYDVFAGPLPRFTTDKQIDKPLASTIPVSIQCNVNAPMTVQINMLTSDSRDAKSSDIIVNQSAVPRSSEANNTLTSPISELTRLAFDMKSPVHAVPQPPTQSPVTPTHPPLHPNSNPPSHLSSIPPDTQSRFDRLPDAVKKAIHSGITPPSFSDALASQNPSTTLQVGKKDHVTSGKTTAFQCKKVRTMNGDLIFMIRVSAKTASIAPNKEFAYILDDAGFVESRIFVDDYPGGDWLDFPLDETANDVLRSRVHDYDEQNRRGPKPAHLAANRKLTKGDIEKDPVSDAGKNISKMSKAPVSTKDIIASSLVFTTTTAAGDSNTTIQKSTHGRSFRSGREKRFSCGICERKFLAQAHLNDHMLIHTGELPYKCMFCNRPFRHKSGLNSHHKRHIQRGVFNRPISSKDKVLYPASDPSTNSEILSQQSKAVQAAQAVSVATVLHGASKQIINPVTGESIENKSENTCPPQYPYDGMKNITPGSLPDVPMKDAAEKPKRKGRKPKQVRKSPVTAYYNGLESVTKQSSSDEAISNEIKAESIEDAFKCNFCSLTFPMRTAYLKHVHRVHKAPNTNEINISEFGPEDSGFSEFDETLIKEEPLDSPVEMEDGLDNGMVENLFPDVTIKEEEIDDEYVQ